MNMAVLNGAMQNVNKLDVLLLIYTKSVRRTALHSIVMSNGLLH